jgi:hypothetical protein
MAKYIMITITVLGQKDMFLYDNNLRCGPLYHKQNTQLWNRSNVNVFFWLFNSNFNSIPEIAHYVRTCTGRIKWKTDRITLFKLIMNVWDFYAVLTQKS